MRDFQRLAKYLTFIDQGNAQGFCTLEEPFNLHFILKKKKSMTVLKIPFESTFSYSRQHGRSRDKAERLQTPSTGDLFTPCGYWRQWLPAQEQHWHLDHPSVWLWIRWLPAHLQCWGHFPPRGSQHGGSDRHPSVHRHPVRWEQMSTCLSMATQLL